jgi:hypothetical protein
MMPLSPYQVGGSLAKDSSTYVERPADSEIYQSLNNGEFCYVFNSRQMGKSSLLVRTRHRLENQGDRCTTIDMTRIGSENITPTQWYKSIVSELWRGLNLLGKVHLKKWWEEQEDISLLDKLNRFLEEVILSHIPNQNIFIFVDEIDSILGLDFSVDDFFAWIRFCYNQRATNPEYKRISFALFGVATPSDLISDKKRTPFNIGHGIDLIGFTPESVQPLITGLKSQFSQPQQIIQAILDWTNGQPFLTQKLCDIVLKSANTMADNLHITPGNEAFWIESLVKSKIIDYWQSQDEPEHLKTIRDRLLRNDNTAGRLLGIVQEIHQGKLIQFDDRRDHIELLLSGLIIKDQGRLKVRNKIYQQVFNLAWVTEQLNQLRPYSQMFDGWIASQKTDSSRLLRGQVLKDAQQWAQGKSLSDLDYQFLAASVDVDQLQQRQTLELERSQAIEAQLKAEQKRPTPRAKNRQTTEMVYYGVKYCAGNQFRIRNCYLWFLPPSQDQ